MPVSNRSQLGPSRTFGLSDTASHSHVSPERVQVLDATRLLGRSVAVTWFGRGINGGETRRAGLVVPPGVTLQDFRIQVGLLSNETPNKQFGVRVFVEPFEQLRFDTVVPPGGRQTKRGFPNPTACTFQFSFGAGFALPLSGHSEVFIYPPFGLTPLPTIPYLVGDLAGQNGTAVYVVSLSQGAPVQYHEDYGNLSWIEGP